MTTPYDDLRGDLGLPLDETVFTDAELDTLWERVSGASGASEQHLATLGLMAMRLRNSAAKLHAYSLVSTSESKEQVFEHFDRIYQEYKPYTDAALGVSRKTVFMSGMRRFKGDLDTPEV